MLQVGSGGWLRQHLRATSAPLRHPLCGSDLMENPHGDMGDGEIPEGNPWRNGGAFGWFFGRNITEDHLNLGDFPTELKIARESDSKVQVSGEILTIKV